MTIEIAITDPSIAKLTKSQVTGLELIPVDKGDGSAAQALATSVLAEYISDPINSNISNIYSYFSASDGSTKVGHGAGTVASAIDSKVDKVSGKGLSTEDYTTVEKSKLAGIATGAQVNTVTSVAGKTGAVTLVKGDVGLGNVDNTSDVNKPVSTATQTALNGKLSTTATAADSAKLGGQLPEYYATAAQVGDIGAVLDAINGVVI